MKNHITESQKKNKSIKLKIALCFLLTISGFIASLNIGSASYDLIDLWQLLIKKILNQPLTGNLETADTVLFSLRIPRTLVAALCGAALSAAGVLSQGLFRNPLASPSILGTGSGASAFAAFSFYMGFANLRWFTVPIASFAGAFLTTGFILYVVRLSKSHSIENLLLAGIAINSFLGAFTSLTVSLSLEQVDTIQSIMYWLLGGFNAKGWAHFNTGIIPISLGLIIAYRICTKLNVLTLGEDIASTLSINVDRLKISTILVISLLVGCSVSLAGAISFVGLIVPHITRMIIGPEHKRLLLVSILNGMSLLIITDLLARTLRSPMELQVGVLIALIGSPFFFWLLIKGWRTPS